MAVGDISAIIDTLVYGAAGGYITRLHRVPGTNIYIVVDSVTAAALDTTLFTFSCDGQGAIGAAPIDSLVLAVAGFSSSGNLVHISGDVFALAYMTSVNVVVQTFTCDASGNLGAAAIDTIILGAIPANISFIPDLKHVAGNIYLVSYTHNAGVGATYRGSMSTIRINSDGTIDEPVLSTYIWSLTPINQFGIRPNILKVSDSHFLHIGGESTPAILGQLTQINVDGAGVITRIGGDFIFDVTQYEEGTIHHVSGDVYVIFYRGGPANTHGMVRTINAGFVVTPTSIAGPTEFYAAAVAAGGVRGVEISSNQSGNGKIFGVIMGVDGAVADQLRTLEISNAGAIILPAIDTQQVNARWLATPDIVHGVGNIYILSSMSGAAFNDETVYSVRIDAGPPTVQTNPATGVT